VVEEPLGKTGVGGVLENKDGLGGKLGMVTVCGGNNGLGQERGSAQEEMLIAKILLEL